MVLNIEVVKRVRTSTAKVVLSLTLSLCVPKPLRPVVTRDTASDGSGASRSPEGRNSLMAFPLSSEFLGSEPTDPEAAAEVPESEDGRGRSWDDESVTETSRVSCRSDLERDLLRRGFEDCFREFSIRP
jgi:hypothetical protein